MAGFPKCGNGVIQQTSREKYDFFLPEATSGNASLKHQIARMDPGADKGREGSGGTFFNFPIVAIGDRNASRPFSDLCQYIGYEIEETLLTLHLLIRRFSIEP